MLQPLEVSGNILDLPAISGKTPVLFAAAGSPDAVGRYVVAVAPPVVSAGAHPTRGQTFTYDALNRLVSARNAGTDCTKKLPDGNFEYWGNTYSYDGWGNLLQKTVMQNQCAGENLNITAGANNRIQTASYAYDAAGNMTSDGSGHNFSYDAENRITALAGV